MYQQLFPTQPQSPPLLEVGETHQVLKDIVPAGADQALILALSPRCPYCEQSMEFYQRLVAQRNAAGVDLPIIAAVSTRAAIDMESTRLKEHDVLVEQVVQLDFAALRIRGVPALLLVDKKGMVQEFWPGFLRADRQQQVMKLI